MRSSPQKHHFPLKKIYSNSFRIYMADYINGNLPKAGSVFFGWEKNCAHLYPATKRERGRRRDANIKTFFFLPTFFIFIIIIISGLCTCLGKILIQGTQGGKAESFTLRKITAVIPLNEIRFVSKSNKFLTANDEMINDEKLWRWVGTLFFCEEMGRVELEGIAEAMIVILNYWKFEMI